MNRQQLHTLVDMVDEAGLDALYKLVMQFIPEDEPLPDEVRSIVSGREEYARGEYVRHEDIDWN